MHCADFPQRYSLTCTAQPCHEEAHTRVHLYWYLHIIDQLGSPPVDYDTYDVIGACLVLHSAWKPHMIMHKTYVAACKCRHISASSSILDQKHVRDSRTLPKSFPSPPPPFAYFSVATHSIHHFIVWGLQSGRDPSSARRLLPQHYESVEFRLLLEFFHII